MDTPKGKTGTIVEVNVGSGRDMLLIRFENFKGHTGNGYCKGTYRTKDHWYLFPDEVEKVNNECIVIYSKDNKVIALNKSTGEKAVAKCSPDDNFDFKVGAELAFKRLMGNKAVEDNSFTLLCVKNWHCFARAGKLYKFTNGVATWYNGEKSCKYNNYDDFIKHNFSTDRCFVPVKEVKRKANVGEYVLVTNSDDHYLNTYKNGDVLKIVGLSWNNEHCIYNNDDLIIHESEYVVLEGYQEVKKSIKVDDKVKVIDIGETYDTYDRWTGLEGYRSHFVGGKHPVNDKTYKVLTVGKHDKDKDESLLLIQDLDTTQVFVINVNGVEKC